MGHNIADVMPKGSKRELFQKYFHIIERGSMWEPQQNFTNFTSKDQPVRAYVKPKLGPGFGPINKVNPSSKNWPRGRLPHDAWGIVSTRHAMIGMIGPSTTFRGTFSLKKLQTTPATFESQGFHGHVPHSLYSRLLIGK